MAVLNAMDVKSGKVVPKVGDFVNGFSYQGGDVHTPAAWSPLTGENYLSSIPADRANLVRGIIQGRAPFPTPTRQSYGSGPQLANQLLLDVAKAEPGFDATIWGERKKAREAEISDYAKSTPGSAGGKFLSANMIMKHAQTLLNQLPQTNNASFTPSNWVLNNIGNMLGGDQLKPYDEAKGKLAAESEKFFTGNAPLESRMKAEEDNLSPSGSYKQKVDTIRTLMDLVSGQLDPLAKRFNELTGANRPPESFLDPTAAAIYKKLLSKDYTPLDLSSPSMLQQMQSQRAPVQPLGTPQQTPGTTPQPTTPQINPTDALLKKYKVIP